MTILVYNDSDFVGQMSSMNTTKEPFASSTSLTSTTLSDSEAMERDALLNGTTNHQHTRQRKQYQRSTFDWLLGVAFLVIVALIWTFASVLVQYIFHTLSFQSPFFLTYVGISLFSVNLPLWYASHVLYSRLKKAWFRALPTNGKLSDKELQQRSSAQTSYFQIFRISAIISPLWFIANFTYNESLNLTSVSSSTIVSSTSTVFTFLLSVVALKEPFVWMKLAGVIFCMAGNISTIFNDGETNGGTDHVVGDLVALFAAFMYAVYTTAIRQLIPDDESVSILLFFGIIGIINMVCLLPFVVVFHYSSIESLSGLSLEIILLISVKGLFDNVLSDYLWARAVLLTSPTVATVGLSLTVPLAIVADFWFQNMPPTNVTLVASALVIVGFVLINIGTKQNLHEFHDPQRSTDCSDKILDSRLSSTNKSVSQSLH
ncbi:unnamed protein product [Peronospora belbahrii]|uniref:EamA domain-containing protein n=1 Tax=Peronospora belbahrii TaxID=622444 RepID=A0AAU9LEU0_9STRA|nr:unnamed protein product [Peronospora belbahrii]CAH0515848.1 unnamed protein product [Peronospora belbahrii]